MAHRTATVFGANGHTGMPTRSALPTVSIAGSQRPEQKLPAASPKRAETDGRRVGPRRARRKPRTGRDAGNVVGVSLGLDVFAKVTPAVGTYTLSVVVPTGPAGTATKSAVASLHSLALLPPIAPAKVTPDGAGGASVSLTLPVGVTEAVVQIVDVGPDNAPAGGTGCNSAAPSAPVYYTIVVRASSTVALSAAHGPKLGSSVTPTLCTAAENTAANAGTAVDADAFTVQTIGFDYPAYEASYPQSSHNPAPLLTGPNGQADITISSTLTCTSPRGGLSTTCTSAATAGHSFKLPR